jgi:hypothetical protein
MYHAKLSLSPTPVTRATLPEKSIGIMVRASERGTGKSLAVYPPRRVRTTRPGGGPGGVPGGRYENMV